MPVSAGLLRKRKGRNAKRTGKSTPRAKAKSKSGADWIPPARMTLCLAARLASKFGCV